MKWDDRIKEEVKRLTDDAEALQAVALLNEKGYSIDDIRACYTVCEKNLRKMFRVGFAFVWKDEFFQVKQHNEDGIECNVISNKGAIRFFDMGKMAAISASLLDE